VLWIDDSLSVLEALHSYLEEIEGIRLRAAGSFQKGLAELESGDLSFDLLIFDFILMSDADHASLQRRLGIELAKIAVGKSVKKFIGYSVLSEKEMARSWENLGRSLDLATVSTLTFKAFQKDSSVNEVIGAVKSMLNGGSHA